MRSSDEPLLPISSPGSLVDGPPSGRFPVGAAALLATVGLAMLVIGGARSVRALPIIGSLMSALALGAVLYWRAALISYWQMVAIAPEGSAASGEDAGSGEAVSGDAPTENSAA